MILALLGIFAYPILAVIALVGILVMDSIAADHVKRQGGHKH